MGSAASWGVRSRPANKYGHDRVQSSSTGHYVVALSDFDPDDIQWPKSWGTPLPLKKSMAIRIVSDDGGDRALGHYVGQPERCGYFLKHLTEALRVEPHAPVAMPSILELNRGRDARSEGSTRCTTSPTSPEDSNDQSPEAANLSVYRDSASIGSRSAKTSESGPQFPHLRGSRHHTQTQHLPHLPKGRVVDTSVGSSDHVGQAGHVGRLGNFNRQAESQTLAALTSPFTYSVSGTGPVSLEAAPRCIDIQDARPHAPRAPHAQHAHARNMKREDAFSSKLCMASAENEGCLDSVSVDTLSERYPAAKELGLDPAKDEHLLWLAEAAAALGLPPGWITFNDDDGRAVYYHEKRHYVTRKHPMLQRFKAYSSQLQNFYQVLSTKEALKNSSKIRGHLAVLLNEVLNRCHRELPPMTPVLLERAALLLGIDTTSEFVLSTKVPCLQCRANRSTKTWTPLAKQTIKDTYKYI